MRARRNASELDIALAATLYQGLDRVDFIAEVKNRARDHRLRAALRTPVVATDAVHDTSFGVVRRPLAPSEPRGTEDIYPTVPHRTFTAVEGAEFSAALVSRGILEVEARPEHPGATTILLTLLRCVGWLSRSDLATRRGGAGPELETPDAQELGSIVSNSRSRLFAAAISTSGVAASASRRTRRRREFFPAGATTAMPPPICC